MLDKTTSANTLGILIKEKRKDSNYTQAELAKLIGINEKHLSRIENGSYLPKFTTYQKLCEILNINNSEIKITENYCLNEKSIKIMNIIKEFTDEELTLCLNFLNALNCCKFKVKEGL